MSKIFGTDVGNYGTKSYDTNIISGFKVSDKPPFTGEHDCLIMDGKYYYITSESFNYDEDKTKDNRCVILTLFSIAEQILFDIKKKNINYDDLIQKEIDKVHDVVIAVGLPPLLKATHEKETIECYEKFFANGDVSFVYKGYKFCLNMERIFVFPQGAPLVFLKYEDDIMNKKYGNYVIVDIGGVTMDIISFAEDGMTPSPERCSTTKSGSLMMYNDIKRRILSDYSITLTNDKIEAVLGDKPNMIKTEVKEAIKNCCREWVRDKIINACVQNGIDFETSPIVFIGGTSILLRPYIEEMGLSEYHTYIDDVHVNAKGYRIYAKALM